MKSTAVVGSMTLISRVLGFVRDMVIARSFGATETTDAFFVAFRIPNFFRRLFSEGSFAQAFLPALSGYQESGDRDGLRRFLDHAAGTLIVLLAVATLIGTVAAPLLILAFAPGFIDKPGQLDLGSELLIITWPYLFFITLTAFAGGVLNTVGQFALPAATPAVLNLTLIAATLWLAPQLDQPVVALALGVFLAGILQLAIQLPALAACGLLPRPKLRFRDAEVRRFLRRVAPAVFGVSVTQVNLLVDTLAASFLISGSVSWLYYSDRLVEFPLGIFGVALGTAVAPQLAKFHARQDDQGFSDVLDWALRWVLVVGLPATLGLMLLASPLLSTLFEYDEFGAADVNLAGRSLMTYALGLLGFIAVKVLAPAFNARHQVAVPVRCGLVAMFANAVLCPLLAFVVAPAGWPHAGLTLATALAALLNAGLLLQALRRQAIYRPTAGWGVLGLRVLVANLAMASYLILTEQSQDWHHWSSLERIRQLAGEIMAGAGIYGAFLLLVGTRPRHLILARRG